MDFITLFFKCATKLAKSPEVREDIRDILKVNP